MHSEKREDYGCKCNLLLTQKRNNHQWPCEHKLREQLHPVESSRQAEWNAEKDEKSADSGQDVSSVATETFGIFIAKRRDDGLYDEHLRGVNDEEDHDEEESGVERSDRDAGEGFGEEHEDKVKSVTNVEFVEGDGELEAGEADGREGQEAAD